MIPVSQVIPVIPVSQVIPVISVSQVIPVIPVSPVRLVHLWVLLELFFVSDLSFFCFLALVLSTILVLYCKLLSRCKDVIADLSNRVLGRPLKIT